MKQESAHGHGLFWRWRHRNDQPPSTDQEWTSWRAEQKRKQRTGEAIVELLRTPANIKAVQAKRVCTPGAEVLTFEEWKRTRTGAHNPLTPLPATPRDTGAIHPVVQHETILPPTYHDPALHMAPDVKREVYSELRTVPSKPLEHGTVPVQNTGEIVKEDHFLAIGPLFEPMDKVPTVRPLTEAERAAMTAAAEMPRQTTGYLDELATLRHNSDTLEVPAYVKQKHTRESEERDA